MSEDTRHEIARRPVVYRVSGAAPARVRRDEIYTRSDGGALAMDLYYPGDYREGERLPAMVVITGFSGVRAPAVLGCSFKDMEWSRCWGQLLAASGIVGIFYTNQDPEADALAVLDHIREHAASLGLDTDRVGILATSGNVPLALSLLIGQAERLRCAVFCYGFMLDLRGSTVVADAAAQWGFANAAAGKSVDDLPQHVPVLVVRAGADQFPRLNEAIDRFASAALSRNLPLTLINHATGPHSFDLLDDSDAARDVIRQMLVFMRQQLGLR